MLLGLETRGVERRLRGLLWAIRHHVGGLRIGRSVSLFPRHSVSIGMAVGLGAGVVLDASGPHGKITIGDRTHVDRNSVLYGQGGIRIGRGCAIAAGVLVYSQSNRFDVAPDLPILEQGTRYAEVVIGDDVWIGAGAIVLPGATIGDHAVVAAGAVVRGAVEPWKIVAGVPARVINDRRCRALSPDSEPAG